jgi:hypothetical protein
MNFYDLDISNYDIIALKHFFKLGDTYTIDDILKKETSLKTKIKEYDVDTSFKDNFLIFIDKTKVKLIDDLTSKTKLHEHSITYKQPIDTFNTDVARGILNKLRKRTVTTSMAFNTIFRNYNSSSISHCNFTIPYPLKNVVSVRLSSFELPDSIYLFNESAKTNCFYIKEYNTGFDKLIKIPEGFYDSTSLAPLLQTTINMTLSDGDPTYDNFIVTIDIHNNRTLIVNKVNRFDMFFITPETSDVVYKNIGWKLGFRMIQYKGEYTYISEGLFDTTTPYLYFVLNDFSISNSSNLVAMFNDSYVDKHMLAKIIPCDECNKNNVFIKREYFGPVDINKIEVKLLNRYGDLVNLNMMDYSFTLDFELVYDI